MITLWAMDSEYKSKVFRDFIASHKIIDGLMVINQGEAEKLYKDNQERFPNSLHNITTGEAWYYAEHPKLKKYFGETLSCFDDYVKDKLVYDVCNVFDNIARFSPNCIVDEPEIKALLEMQSKTFFPFEVSLSSYRNLLFSFAVPKWLWQTVKLTRIRVYGWGNQLNNWKKIDKLFPKMQKSVNIHLASNKKHFKELISYAIDNKKRIMIYAGDKNMQYDYNLFFTELERQLKDKRVNKSIIGSWL